MKSILLLLLLSSTIAHSQNTAKGIKEMTTIQKPASLEDGSVETKTIQYFDALGVEVKTVNYENGEFYFTGISTYNSDGTANTYTRYDEQQKVLSHIECHYSLNVDRGMRETKTYDETGELMAVELDSLDQNGNVLVKYTLLLPDMNSTEKNAYDTENRLIAISVYYDDEFQYTINNTYLKGNDISEQFIECEDDWFGGNYRHDYAEFDKKGNWTICKEYKDGVLHSETYRTILYY